MRTFRLAAPAALLFAFLFTAALKGQPPMTAPGSDVKPGDPPKTIPSGTLKIDEVTGVKEVEVKVGPDGKPKEEPKDHYTFKMKNVHLAKEVIVLKGTVLVDPVFRPGQKAPKGVPSLASGILEVEYTYEGVLTLDDDLALKPGTKYSSGNVLSKDEKISVAVPIVPPAVLTLPSGAQATTDTKLSEKDLVIQLAEARKLAKTSGSGLSQSDFDAALANSELYKKLKAKVDKMEEETAALKEITAKSLDLIEKKADKTELAKKADAEDLKAKASAEEVASLKAKLDELMKKTSSTVIYTSTYAAKGTTFDHGGAKYTVLEEPTSTTSGYRLVCQKQ